MIMTGLCSRWFPFLCLVWLFSGVQIQAAELDRVTFATDWFAQAEQGGYWQALADGTYERHGLDVNIRMGGPQINGMQLLLGGVVDFFMGFGVEQVYAAEKGLPAVAVMACFQKDPQVLMVHPDQPVETLDDLQGYRIATTGITTYWPWLVQEFGLRDDQRRPYNFSITPFIVDSGLVTQGYVTSEPYAARQAGVEPKILLLSDYGYTPYASLVVTSRRMIEQNPDLVGRFVAATREGWANYLEDPTLGNQAIRKANPEMEPERIAYGIQAMKEYALVDGGDAARLGIGAMTDERWQATRQFMLEAGLIDPTTDISLAYTLEFLESLAETGRRVGGGEGVTDRE